MAGLSAARVALLAVLLAAPARGGGFFPTSPFSDKAVGTTAAGFLKSPPGARGDAVGGAYVGTVENSEAVFWNPAGLARLEDSGHADISVAYDSLLESSYSGALAYARPVSGVGVFGAGFLYASQGSLQGYNTVGDPTGSFTPNDMALLLDYAKKLGAWSLGGGVKVIRSQVSDVSGTAFALDLGMQRESAVNTSEGPIDVGVSVLNVGPAMKMGGASDPLPFKFQGGLVWHVSERLRTMLDGVMAVDQDPYVTLGGEGRFPIGELLRASVRGGYNMAHARGLDGLAGMSAGAGLEIDRFRLDYAWVPFGDLGITNRITLGWRF